MSDCSKPLCTEQIVEFKSLVCAQKRAGVLPSCHACLVQRGASSVCNTLEPLEPLQFHRRLFAESIYDQDVWDSLCRCWLFAPYRCSSSGMSPQVILCRISQRRREAHSLPSHHMALGSCATAGGRGCLCLGISTFISPFLSRKMQCWRIHPSRDKWILYCPYLLTKLC